MLPWERRGAPSGTGICLSGGGLRAASFSLGAVQALQQERDLLYGKACADHLAVVSGGSYLGAALLLTASKLAATGEQGRPPLEQHQPESDWVIEHGRYLKHVRTLVEMVVGGVVNFLAFLALFAWAAVLLGCAAVVTADLGLRSADTSWQVAAAAGLLVGGRVALRGLYLDGGRARPWVILAGDVILLASSASAVAAMDRVDALSEWDWWTGEWRLAIALGGGVLAIVGSLGLARAWSTGWGTRLLSWLAARVPAVVGAVLFCLLATWVFPRLDAGAASGDWNEDSPEALLILAVGLLGAFGMQFLARTSLHRMYRDSLATCFSVRRRGGGVEPVAPTRQKLSELVPPPRESGRSFPRLLVCATANVVWDPRDPERRPLFTLPSPARRRFASFVYSHDRCGLPGVANASIATTDLEKITTRSRILGPREQVVSLMSAVASTGAAVSPAMGRLTVEAGRAFLAVANLRLGRWVPNPLSVLIREDLKHDDADARMRRRRGIGGSYDEFVPELFGLHQSDATRIYISDGGHYDNLGLIALLQARCETIWCVDAQADARGRAGQLRNVVKLAKTALEVDIDIDFSVFPGRERGLLGRGYAIGCIRYPGGHTGTLVVVKLGIVPDEEGSEDLLAYRSADRGFAHHGTFLPPQRVMWYGPRRFEKYRAVGYANALAASRAVAAAAEPAIV